MLSDYELIARIAKAKGWKFTGHRYAPWWTGAGFVDAPDWPTDINAAWKLVDEISRYNDWRMEPTDGGDTYRFAVIKNNKEVLVGLADTAARAICLAWLKWKGVEVE